MSLYVTTYRSTIFSIMSLFFRFGSDAHRYVVKLGDYHTQEQDDFERVLSPERIQVHKKYRTDSWEHDVALIRLKGVEGKCVAFNPHTNAACLPAPGSKWGKRPASCVITGWGVTGNAGLLLILFTISSCALVSHMIC